MPGTACRGAHPSRGPAAPTTAAGRSVSSAGRVRRVAAPPARIGRVDTGADIANPGLAGLPIRTEAFAGGSPPQLRAHGTAVAGLLAGIGFAGLLPGAELLVADLFEPPSGEPEARAFEIALGLCRLARGGARVVDLALTGRPHAVLAAAVRRPHDRGIVPVAAAGNGGPGAPPADPAACPEAVAVTAVDRQLRPYPRANRGDYVAPRRSGRGPRRCGAGRRRRHGLRNLLRRRVHIRRTRQ